LAVQSTLTHTNAAATSEHPVIRQTLEHLRFFSFPGLSKPSPAGETAAAETAPPSFINVKSDKPQIPLLPKSETLLLIAAAAQKHNVPAAFVQSIVAAESNFDCGAISPRGAVGLMQLMPETARDFGADPAIPAQNIDAGTRYLRWLMTRYQKDRSAIKRVIAAYNAGPGMVDRYRGIPPFRETRNYVTRVLGFFKQFGGSPSHPAFRG
jgi:soluble lytic murein transglycosylase-like protein